MSVFAYKLYLELIPHLTNKYMQHFQQVETVILLFSLCICILDEEMTFLTQLLKKTMYTPSGKVFLFYGQYLL